MPVITLQKSNTKIIDTSIIQSNPTAGNEGNAYAYVGVGGSSGDIYRGLFFFDLGLVPNDAIINSATLNVPKAYESGLASCIVDIHKITSSWDGSVNWNTRPSYNPAVSQSITVTNGTGSFTADVKSLVQEWINGTSPNYGFLLKTRDEVTLNSVNYFGTIENGNTAYQPTLTIDYTIPSTGKSVWSMWGQGQQQTGLGLIV